MSRENLIPADGNWIETYEGRQKTEKRISKGYY